MKEIVEEYGGTLLSCLGFAIFIALFVTFLRGPAADVFRCWARCFA